jgi:hypothetical protein
MSAPVYVMPHIDSKVKIFINGTLLSTHHSTSNHSKYINFIGENVPNIIENHEKNTFDINLEEFVYDMINKYMEDKSVRSGKKKMEKRR